MLQRHQTSKYYTLFEVEVQHDYFEGNIPKGLRCVPTPSTIEAFREMGLKWKVFTEEAFCIKVYYDAYQFDKPTREAIGTFSFALYADNPILPQVTANKSLSFARNYLYFSNKNGNKTDNRIFLDNNTTNQVADWLLFRGLVNSLDTFWKDETALEIFSLTHTLTSEKIEIITEGVNQLSTIKAAFEAKTTNLPDGYYQLEMAIEPKPKNWNPPLDYYLPAFHDAPFAVVDIHYGRLSDCSLTFPKNVKDDDNHRVYIVPFKARATYWMYNFFSRKQLKEVFLTFNQKDVEKTIFLIYRASNLDFNVRIALKDIPYKKIKTTIEDIKKIKEKLNDNHKIKLAAIITTVTVIHRTLERITGKTKTVNQTLDTALNTVRDIQNTTQSALNALTSLSTIISDIDTIPKSDTEREIKKAIGNNKNLISQISAFNEYLKDLEKMTVYKVVDMQKMDKRLKKLYSKNHLFSIITEAPIPSKEVYKSNQHPSLKIINYKNSLSDFSIIPQNDDQLSKYNTILPYPSPKMLYPYPDQTDEDKKEQFCSIVSINI